jgi:hypothetical protein
MENQNNELEEFLNSLPLPQEKQYTELEHFWQLVDINLTSDMLERAKHWDKLWGSGFGPDLTQKEKNEVRALFYYQLSIGVVDAITEVMLRAFNLGYAHSKSEK